MVLGCGLSFYSALLFSSLLCSAQSPHPKPSLSVDNIFLEHAQSVEEVTHFGSFWLGISLDWKTLEKEVHRVQLIRIEGAARDVFAYCTWVSGLMAGMSSLHFLELSATIHNFAIRVTRRNRRSIISDLIVGAITSINNGHRIGNAQKSGTAAVDAQKVGKDRRLDPTFPARCLHRMVRFHRRRISQVRDRNSFDIHCHRRLTLHSRKVPTALADHVEKNNLQGKLKFSLFVGASSGAETENRWARLDMIERRTPHQVGKEIARGINEGRIKFHDRHPSQFPMDLVYVRAPRTDGRKLANCSRCRAGVLH